MLRPQQALGYWWKLMTKHPSTDTFERDKDRRSDPSTVGNLTKIGQHRQENCFRDRTVPYMSLQYKVKLE